MDKAYHIYEGNEQIDRTHTSYSPQDEVKHAPMRAATARQTERHPYGNVDIDLNDEGGTARYEKGKQPMYSRSSAEKDEHKPELHPQRRESWVERIEAAGKDAFRRSSFPANSDAIIDKLADTLNTISPGIETPYSYFDHRQKRNETEKATTQEKKADNRRKPEKRMSWSQRAMSFFTARPTSEGDEHSQDGQEMKEPAEWKTQADIECEASDAAYDDLQGTFVTTQESISSERYKKPIHRAQVMPQLDPSAAKPTYASLLVTKNGDMEDQSNWFNSNPETARIQVPPLSNTMKAPKDRNTIGIHNATTQQDNKHQKKQQHKNKEAYPTAEPRKTQRKALIEKGTTDVDTQFDSDFENWRHPVSRTVHSGRHDWPESYNLTEGTDEDQRQTNGTTSRVLWDH
ncbi:hypothetical protein BCR43DRAFT_491477 [Syncephalastrum racemosum]|uniref:Uncharacterized protein n=1 Tax=Syncephalastrum racemosum TaxID=13706 RepID=A0A1X2HBZ5_SYNRA|nr:hypothetical protein BCR43DRAFT_491477 [Syncephalastrum racemosum]